jgi:hypothetical protein
MYCVMQYKDFTETFSPFSMSYGVTVLHTIFHRNFLMELQFRPKENYSPL